MIRLQRLAAALILMACAVPAWAQLQFAIGEPAEGAVKSGIGQVSGWAVSDREIVSIEAFIDGASLGVVPYGGSRMDVAAAFPEYPDAENSGFAMKWNYSLHQAGEHLLTLVITEDDGTQTSRDVLFYTTRFNSEFIRDPNAVRTKGTMISSPVDGRLVIEGAEVEGEVVDIELQWDKAAQQFLIDSVEYLDQEPQQNKPPTANAGPNQTVETEKLVSLQGSAADPDGWIASVSWTQVSGPGVALSDPSALALNFTTPEQPADIRLRLTVTDDRGMTDSDDVVITVVPAQSEPEVNLAPVANAGAAFTVAAGDYVEVSGSGSDSDGQVVGWSWQQVSGPAVSLQGASSPTVGFTAPDGDAQVRLRLTVTDDDGATDSDDVIITVQAGDPDPDPDPDTNSAPTANAGPNLTVDAGDAVTITGGGSDSDGSIVGWSWSQVAGTAVSLSGAGSQQVQFTAPNSAGDIRLRLTVTDDDGATGTDDVIITVEAASEPGNTTGETLQSMLDDINEARGQDQVCGTTSYPAQPPLQWSASLADIARQHSMDMAERGYFDHNTLGGPTFGERVWPYWGGSIIGENIAASSANRSDSYVVVEMWMKSPGHCSAIMNPNFSHAGVGKAYDPDNGTPYKYYWTLDFGG